MKHLQTLQRIVSEFGNFNARTEQVPTVHRFSGRYRGRSFTWRFADYSMSLLTF